ncbi:hypothetical protein J3E71DRAFT_380240, partial [Bipolaris maydis]
MYTCTICNRTYRNQNSLTRHSHSHRNTGKHKCRACGVVFYRRDLLTRHVKLHPDQARTIDASRDTTGAGDSGHCPTRKRCHTACLRCRELRTRCNGQLPCTACQKNHAQCEYSRYSSRLSHLARDSDQPDDAQNALVPEPSQDPANEAATSLSSPPCAPRTRESARGTQPQNRGEYLEQSHSTLLETAIPNVNYFDMPLSQHTDTNFANMGDTSMTDLVSWPWLHENLFLPTDVAMWDSTYFQEADSGPSLPAFLPSSLQAHIVNTENDNPNTHYEGHVTLTPKTSQYRVIQDMVTYACGNSSQPSSETNRTMFWQHASTQIAAAFELLEPQEQGSRPALFRFYESYGEHFGPLWPLLSPRNLDIDALHPLLFLVLTSIGAMYCGENACNYGAMAHASIRRTLTMPLELEDDDQDFIWLAQARLLTQVTALYFGQSKAFTYAHHLGALLVAQARRMDLFSSKPSGFLLRKFHQMEGVASDDDRLSVWLQLEARRRLAFGIFRVDTYTSVLLHTKPLVSLEEIDLQLPMCDSVWRSDQMPASLCLQMIKFDQTPGRHLWASDIYRIAMDQHESLPPLDPVGQELLLFGLQYPIWRFSKDQELFTRLVGSDEFLANIASPAQSLESPNMNASPSSMHRPRQPSRGAIDAEAHQLDSATRSMEDLMHERKQLNSALEKWERNLALVKTFVRTNLDRSILMSCLLLFHLGFLRLNAPLEELHQIQYRLADNRVVDDSTITAVRTWARSRKGRAVAERACSLRNIIARESKVPESRRVLFNLLAFIGLHHGAVILWAYSESRATGNPAEPQQSPLVLESEDPIYVDTVDSRKILSSYVELYDRVSPAQWSSFAKAADKLSSKKFPL